LPSLTERGVERTRRARDGASIPSGYRPLGDLGDIAKLGLTLSEAKQILARLQQVVVAVQADSHHTRIGGARAKTDGVLEGSARRKRP